MLGVPVAHSARVTCCGTGQLSFPPSIPPHMRALPQWGCAPTSRSRDNGPRMPPISRIAHTFASEYIGRPHSHFSLCCPSHTAYAPGFAGLCAKAEPARPSRSRISTHHCGLGLRRSNRWRTNCSGCSARPHQRRVQQTGVRCA